MDKHKSNFRPPHPGEMLREEYLKPLKLTQEKLAKALGVSRKTVSELVNEKASVTPEMAMRIGLAFGERPEIWLNLQAMHDAWKIQQEEREIRKQVTPIKLVAAA